MCCVHYHTQNTTHTKYHHRISLRLEHYRLVIIILVLILTKTCIRLWTALIPVVRRHRLTIFANRRTVELQILETVTFNAPRVNKTKQHTEELSWAARVEWGVCGGRAQPRPSWKLAKGWVGKVGLIVRWVFGMFVSFFLSWVANTQLNYWTKRMVGIRWITYDPRNCVQGSHYPRRCKTSSVCQSAGLLIPRSSVRFRQELKNRALKSTWIWAT